MTDLTVIILTYNEELHIARAIQSVAKVARHVLVVDSGSTDKTCEIAGALGARVLFHEWTNHAAQFNWALDQIRGWGGWVLRLDADEIATPELIEEIASGLPAVDGLLVPRSIVFQGQMVRFGGVGRVPVLRLFRNGRGRAESRWMDEHIIVTGKTGRIRGRIIDENLRPLDWWIAKHNNYAAREVADILCGSAHPAHQLSGPTAARRWIKTRVYAQLPGGLRAGLYFFYRFFLRGGVFDSAGGRRFHVLQGFWYRYLVDAKLAEVRRLMHHRKISDQDALLRVLELSMPGEVPERSDKAA